MQVMLRAAKKYADLTPGEIFHCSVRSAPYVFLKTDRGLAVVINNGETCEISPDELCMPIGGAFVESGTTLPGAPRAAVPGATSGEIRGTVGMPAGKSS